MNKNKYFASKSLFKKSFKVSDIILKFVLTLTFLAVMLVFIVKLQ